MRKNNAFAIFLIFILSLCLVSCGGDEKKADVEIEVDIEELASNVVGLSVYADADMVKLNDDNIEMRYDFGGQYDDIVAYASATSASDEIIIICAKDRAGADALIKSVDEYRKERIELYASYAIEQTPKLEGAYLEGIGRYVIFAAADDISGIEEIVSKLK